MEPNQDDIPVKSKEVVSFEEISITQVRVDPTWWRTCLFKTKTHKNKQYSYFNISFNILNRFDTVLVTFYPHSSFAESWPSMEWCLAQKHESGGGGGEEEEEEEDADPTSEAGDEDVDAEEDEEPWNGQWEPS